MPSPAKTWADGDSLLSADQNAAFPSVQKHTTTVTTSGTGEQDLNTVTFTGGDIRSTGGIRITAAGHKTGAAGFVTITLYIGATAIFTTDWSTGNSVGDVYLNSYIINTAANAQKTITLATRTDYIAFGMPIYSTAAIDTTSNFAIKWTANCSNAGDTFSGYFLVAEEVVI